MLTHSENHQTCPLKRRCGETAAAFALHDRAMVINSFFMAEKTEARVTMIWGFDGKTARKIPLFTTGISAGFPSPADDFIDKTLDLNEFLITHPSATFFVRVEGTSMIEAGINPGDILIVDKALEPRPGSIVIAVLDGEFTVKRYQISGGRYYLLAANPDFKPIEIKENMMVEIWGVVTYVIHKV